MAVVRKRTKKSPNVPPVATSQKRVKRRYLSWQWVSAVFLFAGLPLLAFLISTYTSRPDLIASWHKQSLEIVQNFSRPDSTPAPIAEQENLTAVKDNPPPFIATHHPDFFNANYDRESVLNDIDQRIGDEFVIPANLRERVGFWFDAYTKYSSSSHVIHHAQYPWIVFEVVETDDFFHEVRALWKSQQAADRHVAQRKKIVQQALSKLAKRKVSNKDALSEFEQGVLSLMQTLPGSLQENLRIASNQVRVQLGQKNFFHDGLMRSVSYLPAMEDIFKEHGLPSELTRLPFVESSFNTKAISKVGASGIWQFMPSVGKKFLQINDHIDERNSPLKATAAAAKLLKQNLRILGSWELALTAYNHGPGGVLRGVKKVKSSSLAALIDQYSSASFSFASKNFYCEFLAALYAEKYHQEIYGDIPDYYIREIQAHRLDRNYRARDLAEEFDVELHILEDLNYDLKRAIRLNSTLPRGLQIYLPSRRDNREQAT